MKILLLPMLKLLNNALTYVNEKLERIVFK